MQMLQALTSPTDHQSMGGGEYNKSSIIPGKKLTGPGKPCAVPRERDRKVSAASSAHVLVGGVGGRSRPGPHGALPALALRRRLLELSASIHFTTSSLLVNANTYDVFSLFAPPRTGAAYPRWLRRGGGSTRGWCDPARLRTSLRHVAAAPRAHCLLRQSQAETLR